MIESSSVNLAAYDPMTAPILYVNMAWMKRYQGHTDDDPVKGGNFSWLKRKGNSDESAHEQYNFQPHNGRVVAYVPGSPNPRISKLGAPRGASEVEGVLVVFMARDPLSTKTLVVGCYHNATVSSQPQFRHKRGSIEVDSPISAAANDAVLVPVAARSEQVPSWRQAVQLGDSGGYGQKAFWYGKPDVNDRVRRFLLSSWHGTAQKPTAPPSGRGPRQQDVQTRIAVEEAAMKAAMLYFGVPPEGDVSKACCGWDLEVEFAGQLTRIEVKGLSGTEVKFELTPNEYEKMQLHGASYVLFVLANALGHSPVATVFRHTPESKANAPRHWVSDGGDLLRIAPKTGAVCSL